MKQVLLSMLIRLKNPGTLIAVVSGIVIILNELGVVIDNESVSVIVNTVCGILIALGVMNDSTDGKLYIPGLSDKLIDKNKDK